MTFKPKEMSKTSDALYPHLTHSLQMAKTGVTIS